MNRDKIGFFKCVDGDNVGYNVFFSDGNYPSVIFGFDNFVCRIQSFLRDNKIYDASFVARGKSEELNGAEVHVLTELITRHNQSALARLALNGQCTELTDPRVQHDRLGENVRIGDYRFSEPN